MKFSNYLDIQKNINETQKDIDELKNITLSNKISNLFIPDLATQIFNHYKNSQAESTASISDDLFMHIEALSFIMRGFSRSQFSIRKIQSKLEEATSRDDFIDFFTSFTNQKILNNEKRIKELQLLVSKWNESIDEETTNKVELDRLMELYNRAQDAISIWEGPSEVPFFRDQNGFWHTIDLRDGINYKLRAFETNHCAEMQVFVEELEKRIHLINEYNRIKEYNRMKPVIKNKPSPFEMSDDMDFYGMALRCNRAENGAKKFAHTFDELIHKMTAIRTFNNEKQKIISMLRKYIENIENNSTHGCTEDVKQGFFFFASNQAGNENIHYKLAKKLLKDLTDKNKDIMQLFSNSYITEEGNKVLAKMELGPNTRLKALKNAIKNVLNVSVGEEDTEQEMLSDSEVSPGSISKGFTDKS